MIKNAIDFVKGSVDSKNLIPVLKHFRMEQGRITGFNGRLSISSPIDADFNATPEANQFIKAFNVIGDSECTLKLTPNGRLSITSGSFRTLVPCSVDPFPEVIPEGEWIQPPDRPDRIDWIALFRKLIPFVGEDASRPWCNGMLFKQGSIYVTNNIILIQKWIGIDLGVEINVPAYTIRELIRVNEQFEGIQVTNNSITFHYEGNRWIRSQLLETQWPDIDTILNVQDSNQEEFTDEFFDKLEKILPFTDELDRVFLIPPETMATSTEEGEYTAFNLEYSPNLKGCFNGKQLLLLGSIALTIDFSFYPVPCPFYGDGLRGVIVGLRY